MYNASMTEELQQNKPWLTPSEQIARLKSKGVRFNLVSEQDAEQYLIQNNNYFRLKSYRTGFSKVESGARKGEYANLDFQMLVDLSIVDMLLRFEMLPMTLDIEHFAKVKLLGRIEQAGEDGYSVVADYLGQYDVPNASGVADNRVIREIEQGKSSPYVAGLLEKYPDHDYPAWVFLEVITFGTLLYFIKFCGERFDDKALRDEFYLLQTVKSLRNACAHNNCILNNVVSGKPMYAPQNAVSKAVGSVPGIGAGMRKAKLGNDRTQQIATTMYMHKELVSEGVRSHRAEKLAVFKQRMNKHLDYYKGNCQVLSCFDFISKLIDAWYPPPLTPGA